MPQLLYAVPFALEDRELFAEFRRDSDDQLIGFGSLGRTRRRWPPPTGEHINLLIIPQLAVDIRFHGQPADDPPRYSHQILGHLIAEARDEAVQTGVSLLLLYVHEQNARARRLYEQFDFTAVRTERDDPHVLMTHRLGDLTRSCQSVAQKVPKTEPQLAAGFLQAQDLPEC